MELNQYQKEMEQLLALQDKKVSRKLFNLYVDTIKDLKKSLLVEYQNFENLSRSKKMDLKRMDALLETLERRTEALKDGLNGIIPQHVKRTSKLAYNELFYEYEQTHTGLDFALLKEDELEVLINTPVAGFRLSERLNDGVVPDLKKGIKSELERSFLHGDSYAKTAKRLSWIGAASYSRAMRIARTEAGRVSSIARQKSQLEAQSLGVEFKKVWSAVYDKRTRHNHQELDEQAVDPEGYFEIGGNKTLQPKMFGIASEDINCRCRTISSFEDDDTPLLKRDNETGEVGEWKNYREWREWREAIDRRQFTMDSNADYLKSSKSTSPQRGKTEVIRGDEVSFRGRKVLNSKYNLYISDNLGSGRKAFSYYERQIDDVMRNVKVPQGSPEPRFVLYDSAKDIGKKHNFGAYDPKTNTVFLDAAKANEKAIVKRLQSVNKKWERTGNSGKFFAVDNDARSPLVHELGHYKHYIHIEHHAKVNGLTYAESKVRFNEKLLEFLKSKRYNISEDISGYASEHLKNNAAYLNATNEVISEANTLSFFKNDNKAKQIIKFLEKEEW